MLLNPGLFVPLFWVFLVFSNLAWLDQSTYHLSKGFIFYVVSLSLFCAGVSVPIMVVFRKVYTQHRYYTAKQFEKYRILRPLLQKYFVYLYSSWFILQCVNIFYSGGFPLLWLATGDGRSYTDFGIPTFSGLTFTLRNFVFCLGLILIVSRNASIAVKLMTFSIIFTAAFVELSRGHTFFMLAHGLAVLSLYSRLRVRRFLKISGLGISLMFLFGYIQLLRYPGGYETLLEFAANNGVSGGPLMTMLSPVLLYLLIPFSNASLNFENSAMVDIGTGYSLSGLLPSIVRDSLSLKSFELINEAHNTVTFFTPLFMDYGYMGSGLFIFFLVCITSSIALKAKSGNIFCILVYPIFFSSLLLSFFANYFFSLTFFFYIFIAVLLALKITKNQRSMRV